MNIKTVHLYMRILALSAYKNYVARNQAQQLNFPHASTSEEIVNWFFDEWNASIGFRKRKVCLSREVTPLPASGWISPQSLQCNEIFQKRCQWTFSCRWLFFNWGHDSRIGEGCFENIRVSLSRRLIQIYTSWQFSRIRFPFRGTRHFIGYSSHNSYIQRHRRHWQWIKKHS